MKKRCDVCNQGRPVVSFYACAPHKRQCPTCHSHRHYLDARICDELRPRPVFALREPIRYATGATYSLKTYVGKENRP